MHASFRLLAAACRCCLCIAFAGGVAVRHRVAHEPRRAGARHQHARTFVPGHGVALQRPGRTVAGVDPGALPVSNCVLCNCWVALARHLHPSPGVAKHLVALHAPQTAFRDFHPGRLAAVSNSDQPAFSLPCKGM